MCKCALHLFTKIFFKFHNFYVNYVLYLEPYHRTILKLKFVLEHTKSDAISERKTPLKILRSRQCLVYLMVNSALDIVDFWWQEFMKPTSRRMSIFIRKYRKQLSKAKIIVKIGQKFELQTAGGLEYS